MRILSNDEYKVKNIADYNKNEQIYNLMKKIRTKEYYIEIQKLIRRSLKRYINI